MLKLTAIGFLGQDAVLKETGGKKVINFSIAHTEKWKDVQGTPRERTTWVECSLWDNEKLAQFLKKGQQVYIEGTPNVNAYVSKESGELNSSLKCTVFSLQLLGKKEDKPERAYSEGISNAANSGQGMGGQE